MSIIVANDKTSEETVLRINNPIIYIPKKDEAGPLSLFNAYFGLPGRDPKLLKNRKTVYALQETGVAIPIDQPVRGSAGGTPIYNGSYVGLAVAGSFSLKIEDENGQLEYNIPQVDALNLQGYSGVIAEESQTVGNSQEVEFAKIEATTASFYQSTSTDGETFKGEYLKKDVDYRLESNKKITLLKPTANGVVILARQMDPTGQVIPVTEGSSALFVFSDIASAVKSDLQDGDTLTINGGDTPGDNLGGNKYIAVIGQPETQDGENVINLDNGNQIKAISNNFKLARYSEDLNTVSSVSGTLILNLDDGNAFKVVLTESVSSISFVNVNQRSNSQTPVTLIVQQGAAEAFTISFSGIRFPDGVSPIVTEDLNGKDRFFFITDDGSTWDGGVIGQKYS